MAQSSSNWALTFIGDCTPLDDALTGRSTVHSTEFRNIFNSIASTFDSLLNVFPFSFPVGAQSHFAWVSRDRNWEPDAVANWWLDCEGDESDVFVT